MGLRRDSPWTPALAIWDRDARWNTHLDRIHYASACVAEGQITQREQSLEGSRKVKWWSILDVECPVCGVGVNSHCNTLPSE